ncbi:hypothetical protein KEM52_004017 [Ascosphaera acerosa]|nr:hypothetical protein KEM52_004017 [Ascosphaera acerosa]
MFHYLRRDHRNHKDYRERGHPQASQPLRPQTSKERISEPGSHTERRSSTTADALLSGIISLTDHHSTLAQDLESPAFLPPLTSLPPITTSPRFDGWGVNHADRDASQQPPQGAVDDVKRPLTSEPRAASPLSLSRTSSKKSKSHASTHIGAGSQKDVSLLAGLRRPATSLSSREGLSGLTVHPDTPSTAKPTSPWRLTFGSSKSKEVGKAASPTDFGSSSQSDLAALESSLPNLTISPSPSALSFAKMSPGATTQVEGTSSISGSTSHSSSRLPHASLHGQQTQDAPNKEKRRLNLLNPMALLARRRSGHNGASRQEAVALPALPDDYDPRIRGSLVHDFSSPRVRNLPPINVERANESYRTQQLDTPHAYEVPLPPSTTNDHFADEAASHAGSHEDDGNSILPSPTASVHQRSSEAIEDAVLSKDTTPPVASTAGEDEQQSSSCLSVPSKTSSRRSVLGMPQHAPSTHSRFSFDMAGVGPSAQERLLEEKHKEKEAEERARRIAERIQNPHLKRDSESTFDDRGEFDDFDYDAMLDDDDGAYEERIPGVNVDAEDDEPFFPMTPAQASGQQARPHMFDEHGYSATPFAVLTSAQYAPPNSATAPPTFSMISPVDEQEQSILSDFSLSGTHTDHPPVDRVLAPMYDTDDQRGMSGELGSVSTDLSRTVAQPTIQETTEMELSVQDTQPHHGYQPDGLGHMTGHTPRPLSLSQPVNDDLFYDDGLFSNMSVKGGNPEETSTIPFNEDMLDDESSYLYDKEQQRTVKLDAFKRSGLLPVAESPTGDASADPAADEDDVVRYDPGQFPAKAPLRPQNTLAGSSAAQAEHGGKLSLYHSVLVDAVNKAALEGRFVLESPTDSTFGASDGPTTLNVPPHPAVGNDRDSSNFSFEEVDDTSNPLNDFEYDNVDDDDEDSIIAAANAEALENDEEGTYGADFGFYASAPPDTLAADLPKMYGGYFGERGIDMNAYVQGKNGLIHRSHSGRATDFQEPSLTPITERSEWSVRNSLGSVPHSFSNTLIPNALADTTQL